MEGALTKRTDHAEDGREYLGSSGWIGPTPSEKAVDEKTLGDRDPLTASDEPKDCHAQSRHHRARSLSVLTLPSSVLHRAWSYRSSLELRLDERYD